MKKTKMLKKNYEFRKVMSRGIYYSGKNIEAFIQKNNEKFNFLGLAISTKVAKAVGRNKIKRLIRENYRLLEDKLREGNNIVFLWKKKSSLEELNFENVKKDIVCILKKADILEE